MAESEVVRRGSGLIPTRAYAAPAIESPRARAAALARRAALHRATMGKGSNVNKKMAAQAANAKDKTATKEERAASKAKAEKDSAAFICKICRQTFMVSATPAKLYTHVTAKHDKEAKTPQNCFDALAGYDPSAPAPAAAPAVAAAKKPAAKKKDDDLSALLDAGLSGVGKKK